MIQYIPKIGSAVMLFRRSSEDLETDQFLGPAGVVWEPVDVLV